MQTITDIELAGKRTLIRVDFNVPLDKAGQISDDARIRRALPTVQHAVAAGAKVVLASHLGRPEGKPVPRLSLQPVARRLAELLARPVRLAPDCVGGAVESLVDHMQNGDVVLLENLRFHAGEQQNSDAFAAALARLCDVYVNDAFAVCHRANASVVAVTRHVATCAAGLLLETELNYFEKAMTDPRRPLAAIIGGAKVSSKLAALQNMLQHVDKLFIGGAMANTFLKSSGCPVGTSKVEDDLLEAAAELMASASRRGIRLYLPVDVVAARHMDPASATRKVPAREIPADYMALDIGPATAMLYAEALADAGTIIWNGPMGVFELQPFSNGTAHVVKSLAASNALTIVGGGDTGAAVHKSGMADKVSYISTGGGAFLTLLEGRPLVAVSALLEAQQRAA